ncbi:hypothetical protein VNO78_19866 [Psophocarpus tetragonolobus]|uniref:Uncharacterized protein n=1 Tax=Psophocarpus tetragonolobus TaxID=3891 RepID=A0AAN9XGN1_PSOTE
MKLRNNVTKLFKEGRCIHPSSSSNQTLSGLAFAPSHSLSPKSPFLTLTLKPNLLMKLPTLLSSVSESGSIP